MSRLRLGVNVDHVATVRQARGVDYPDPLEAALAAEDGGATGITIHLREDRRHIQDHDVRRIADGIRTKLNLELALAPEVLAIACEIAPADACIVPEKREELTTEGGLAVAGREAEVAAVVARLTEAGVRVSLFIDPVPAEIEAAVAVGAPVIELHTGAYANATDPSEIARELQALRAGAELASSLGLVVNGGHGLTLANVGPIAALPAMEELNIGHSIVARALLVGMREAAREMLAAMLAAEGGTAVTDQGERGSPRP